MELSLFYQLSLILVLSAATSLIFRALRQPLIIGYIVTGFLVGPSLLGVTTHNQAALESFSQIGIVLLLFIIGLGLDTAVIRSTGKPVLVTFTAIVAGVGATGWVAAMLLGFTSRESLVIATGLLFSSTIIVVKALVDKKEQLRLYSQIAIGVLLIEDVAATVALLFVSTSGHTITLSEISWLLVKGAGLAAVLAIAGKYVMPRLARTFARSQELLYMFALAWGFGVASLFHWAGFSIEVGALFAGVALAHLTYAQEITARLKPLRDFFLLLFFIGLGQKLGITSLGPALVPALVFAGIILVTKPFLTLLSLGALGYTKQTSFKAAVHLSQISEFSIILAVLAEQMGVVSASVPVVLTLTALLTIVVSSYLMNYDNALYQRLKHPLAVFERAETKQELRAMRHYPLILLGYQRGGHEFIETFRHMQKRYVVVDYDPGVIETLEHSRVNHIYGDATDLELLDEIGVHKSELVISTISNAETNHLLVTHVVHRNRNAVFICHAANYEEAEMLYAAGATYVILPHFIGSEQINSLIKRHGSNKRAFEKYRQAQAANLSKLMLSA